MKKEETGTRVVKKALFGTLVKIEVIPGTRLDLLDIPNILPDLGLLPPIIDKKKNQEKDGYSCNSRKDIFHHF